MPTACDLYWDILDFLARGTSARSAEGPHDINIGVPTPAVPAWGSPTPLSHLACGLLPTCTLGKGERSAHQKLHAHLAGLTVGKLPKYCLISEFPFLGTRETLDAIAVDIHGAPLAAIELKHYSIHQGAKFLLSPANIAKAYTTGKNNRRIPPLPSLDSDYVKCVDQQIRFANFPSIGRELPLIQVGLLTTLHNCTPTIPRTNHPVNFISGPYWNGQALPSGVAAQFATDISNWWNRTGTWLPSPPPHLAPAVAVNLAPPNKRYSHEHAKWGWGPEEAFSIPAAGAPAVTVTGRVGYVLVMTPPVQDDECANTPT